MCSMINFQGKDASSLFFRTGSDDQYFPVGMRLQPHHLVEQNALHAAGVVERAMAIEKFHKI